MEKEKSQWKKKLAYSFDAYMEKGIKAQFGLLLAIFLVVVTLAGVIVYFLVQTGTLGEGVWDALMHIIDQGTITGDERNDHNYLTVMLLVTLCGMVLTSSLIAIITNALNDKMDNLRQGHSEVLEDNHIVIVGFDDNIYGLLSELVIGNEDAKVKRAIVVIDEDNDKQTMDKLIADHVTFGKNTRIICRSGKLVTKNIYDQIGLCKAASIVINRQDDFQSLRILLAVTTYLHNRGVHSPVITALFHEQTSLESAEYVVARFPRARILFFEDMLARIIAQVCRQPGLSYVLSQVFGYDGSEFYIEDKDAEGNTLDFAGEKFGDVVQRFSNTVVVGYKRSKKATLILPNTDGEKVEEVMLNPAPDTVLQSGDKIVHLAVHSQAAVLREPTKVEVDQGLLQTAQPRKKAIMKFLVLDWNRSLSIIVKSLDDFVEEGSSVHVVSDQEYDQGVLAKFAQLKNITVDFELRNDLFNYDALRQLLEPGYTNVLIMSGDKLNVDNADARVAMLLLHLRTIINDENSGHRYDDIIITSQLNTADNQNLLQVANVNDFVVGSEITNRIMAQVANEPRLTDLFEEILDARGSEIYLRPATRFIKPGSTMSFDEVATVLYNYVNYEGDKLHDILLGYKFTNEAGEAVVELNPRANGDLAHTFSKDDKLVVLSTGEDKHIQK